MQNSSKSAEHIKKQEYIPVWCIPPAAVSIGGSPPDNPLEWGETPLVPEGLTTPEGHNRRPLSTRRPPSTRRLPSIRGHQTRRRLSIRRPPNQKATPEGHQTRRPHQKAITEGHTLHQTRHPAPQEQTPLGADTPPVADTPQSRHPPGADTPPPPVNRILDTCLWKY